MIDTSMRKLLVLAVLPLALGCGSSTTGPSGAPQTPAPAAPASPGASQDAMARYRVTFDATWSAGTHPDRFPGNPHFSPLVGVTHNENVSFWRAGEIASDGIEAMAELGATSPLDALIRAAIDSGAAEFLLLGGGIARSPGSVSLELDVSRSKPYVTLVSMIAPSPDWFVGISSVNFLDSGDWPNEVVVELHPYDAGTDNGTIYTARDSDTRPREPIRRIEGAPFASGGVVAPLGTFTFTRLR